MKNHILALSISLVFIIFTSLVSSQNPVIDSDGDGLSDEEELRIGTDLLNPDTDLDGLSDYEELTIGTNPLNPDTDYDSIPDMEEINLGTDPLLSDTDLDTFPDNEDRSPLDPNIPIPQQPEKEIESPVNLEEKKKAIFKFGEDIPVKEEDLVSAADEKLRNLKAIYNLDDNKISLEIEKERDQKLQKVLIIASEKEGYLIQLDDFRDVTTQK